MIGLLQRVTRAQVDVEDRTVGAIGPGLMVLVCAERGDHEANADRLLERLLNYRVFSDADGRMNLSLHNVGGGLLLVRPDSHIAWRGMTAPHDPHNLFDRLRGIATQPEAMRRDDAVVA